jgi:glycerate kinase
MIAELDAALKIFADIAKAATGRDVAEYPGAGAAGGLGAGMMFFTNSQLKPGVEIVLEATGFSGLVSAADLVITGEGRTDFQTAFGKAPVGVAKVAKQYNVPVICIAGGLGQGHEDVHDQGVDALMSVVPQPMSLEDCMQCGAELIVAATSRVMRLVKVGMEIRG